MKWRVLRLPEMFGVGMTCECSEGQKHEACLTCGMCTHKRQETLKENPQSKGAGCHFLGNNEGIDHGECTGNPKIHVACAAGSRPGSGEPMEVDVEPPNEHQVQPLVPPMNVEAIRGNLYLLHAATGHGPKRHLIQPLRRRGVTPQVLREAERFECPVCQERQRPKPRPLATLEPLPPKWSTVACDLGTWEHLLPTNGTNFFWPLMRGLGSEWVGSWDMVTTIMLGPPNFWRFLGVLEPVFWESPCTSSGP